MNLSRRRSRWHWTPEGCMKFAAFPKFLLLAALASALTRTGCGFTSSAYSGSAPTAGNWSFVATSTVTSGQVSHLGGNLTVSGNSVSSTMHSDLPCFDPSVPFTFSGSLQNKQITFTSPANANNQVITLIATVTSSSALTGTYTVTAGGGCAADQGNVTAALVPSLSGTWTGQIIGGQGGNSVTLSMALIQASTASIDGTYALTGNLTYANSSCSKSDTINNSFTAGSTVVINGTTLEQDAVTQASISYNNAFLNNPASPTSMTGDYLVTGGYCGGNGGTTTFTKQ
jgi:hypothetical protein